MIIDRLPPQDIETESACLASAILSRDALYRVTEILQPEDFYLDKHRVLYEIIQDLDKRNIPVDITTIKQQLDDRGLFDEIGEDTLVNLYRTAATSANAEHYAKRIKELSLRRKLIEYSEVSLQKCYDMTRETTEVIDEIERDIFLVTESNTTSDYQSIDVVIENTLENIIKWKQTKRHVTGIASGFVELDEKLTGFHESELIIIAARPGMGKTAFALNIMNNIGLRENKAVLFFSLEMPAVQLGMRMLCIESMVDSQIVRTGYINKEQENTLFEVSKRLVKSKIYIDDTPSLSIMDIKKKARKLHHKLPDGLGLIVVDYLQLVTSTAHRERHLQIAEISRMLKQLARELKAPVIALSQLSRAVEARVDQVPTLADLRESGSIEQDADVVMFIYREDKVKKDSEKKGIAEIIVAKQRNGPTGSVHLLFWEQFTKFGNMSREHLDEEATIVHEYQ